MPGGRKPPHLREKAVRALIESSSIEEAAERCGVSERTLRAWLKEPDFRDLYRQARRTLIDGAVLLLQRASRRAVRALVRQLRADKPADVIRAAEAVLDRAFRGSELLDLTDDVEELKRQLDELKKGAGHDGAEGRGEPEASDSSAGPAPGPQAEPGQAGGGA